MLGDAETSTIKVFIQSTCWKDYCIPLEGILPHCSHESSAAKEAYEREICKVCEPYVVSDSGLVNIEWPYLGAFDCCGKGSCEVKCPFCFKAAISL